MPDEEFPEDKLAKELAEVHEAMLEGRDVTEQKENEQLGSGVEVLKLIEHVRSKEDSASQSFVEKLSDKELDGRQFEPAVPPVLGRYKIVRLLGEGSHGLVYLAVDTQLDREVALKVPRVEVLVSSELRKRFLMEAKAAAALSHPNIVPVFESGNEGNVCFISYAYCEGKPLSDWLDHWRATKQPLSPKVAAQLMATLADAVQYAHSRGVVHRDLKPSNLLVPQSDVSPNEETVRDVQILDFGLAKSGDIDSSLTKTGAIVGTPAYMSPEQALGRGSNIRPATDVYSLGAILFELLCLERPFEEASTLETLEAVRTQEPTAPSRIVAKTPADLEAICLKCLEKKPQDRYSSAAHLREDLERFLRKEPILAKPISQWEFARRWIAKHPLVSGLSAALITTLVVATCGLAALSLQLKASADRSKAAEQAATKLVAELSKDLKSRTQNDLIKAWTQVIDGGNASAHSYFERANCYWQNAEFSNAIADLEAALELDPNHLWANDYLAWILVAGPIELRDPKRAKSLLRNISDHIETSWATLTTACFVEYRIGNYEKCCKYAELATEKHGDNGTQSIQYVHAMAAQKLGDPDEARKHYDIAEQKMGELSSNSNFETKLLRQEVRQTLEYDEVTQP